MPREAVLPLSLAGKAASSELEKCAQDGYRVSVAVVDRAGLLRSFLRADGAGPHTVESTRKKAYTAASMRGATATVAELIAKTPAVQGLQQMNDKILFLGGGLPIDIAVKSSVGSASEVRQQSSRDRSNDTIPSWSLVARTLADPSARGDAGNGLGQVKV